MSLLKDDMDMYRKGYHAGKHVERKKYEEGGETHTMPDGTVMPGATHEDYEMMMDEPASLPEEQEQDILPETPMESDETMEDEYLDFILDEALDEEEEDFLMNILQGNEQLSIIFDKVIDVAQEFAGSGPVEGPGSGVSDSIPARLSDGEFVMTAKAAEVMGPENLQELMMEAENAADRQAMFTGGPVTRDKEKEDMAKDGSVKKVEQTINVSQPQVDSSGATIVQDDDLVSEELTKLALYNREGAHIHS